MPIGKIRDNPLSGLTIQVGIRFRRIR